MEAPPKVSVITPLYNSSAFIRATLDSLRAQTYEDWESILVDDGSTDDTAEVVRPYLEDARFRLIRQENRGIAGARNTAIQAASGKWVCLLDHDDRWLPRKLEKQIAFAREHSFDITCTDAFIVTENERWVYSRGFPEVAAEVQRAAHDPSVDVFGLLIKLDFLCASSVMIRRTLFDERGLLDPSAVPADDYEMWLRCLPEAKLGFLGEPLIEYMVHANNYSRDEPRMIEQAIRVLQLHRKRHALSALRRRQFDESLAYQFGLLFKKLSLDRSKAYALTRSLSLMKDGPGALRLLRFAVWRPLAERARHAARYRLGLAPRKV
ncbi:MAG TPA: glycosyltransferase family 2 protein [Pyrinomonadaceae bacterium]